MGGHGSGRWHFLPKELTNYKDYLDLREWKREGALEPGKTFIVFWELFGSDVSSARVTVEYDYVRLVYRTKNRCGEFRNHDYQVRLVSQQMPFGGSRKWFECPADGCGKRVAVLYGGNIFACRECQRLAYPSQRKTAFQRYQRKAEKIRQRLGWEPVFMGMYGNRPTGMHRATYKSLLRKLGRLESGLHI